MTILFFSRLFYPHGGGVETHVREIGKRLVKMGHKVTVVTETPLPSAAHNTSYHSNSESAKMTGEIDGVRIVRVNGGKEGFWKKFRIWFWLFKHRSLIASADIVHAHDVFFWYLPFRFLYTNKPVYTTFHGYETKFPPAKKAVLIRMISEKLSFGNICVGGFISKWYGTSPTYTTYGGTVVLSSKYYVLREKKDSKLKILFIGRLEEDIGIGLYLQAIRKLKEKKDIEVTFLGEGSFKKEASKYGEVIANYSNDTNYYSELLQKVDVVFASSYLSILSAMSAKKPVIAVYTNKLKKDYLVMTPFAEFIAVVDSADKIMNEVENLGEKHTKADQAYNWVKEQTWEKVVEMYLRLWKI